MQHYTSNAVSSTHNCHQPVRLSHLEESLCTIQAAPVNMQVSVSESGMTNRLDTMENYMHLISAQIGLDAVSFPGTQTLPRTLPTLSDQVNADQQGSATSASLMQQLRDMRAELSHLQQAQLRNQTHTSPVASTQLARLQDDLKEQSNQVQQLHQMVAGSKQDITVLQTSTAAQERMTARLQQGHQDLLLQVNNVSTSAEGLNNGMRDAISRVEEQHAVAHAQLSQDLSQHHTNLEKLSSSSSLHDERFKQHSAMLAKHEQQLVSSEMLGAEAKMALQSLQERVGSPATSASVAGVSGAAYTSSGCHAPRCLIPTTFISTQDFAVGLLRYQHAEVHVLRANAHKHLCSYHGCACFHATSNDRSSALPVCVCG